MDHARRAGPGDLDACAVLFAQACAAARDVRGGDALLARSSPRPADSLVDGWYRSEDAVLFAGTFDGVVVGLGAGILEHVDTTLIGRVACCYVEPEARGVGVGGTLMAALVEWFTERGCRAIDALALPGDRDTKQLFETSGFKTRLLTLRRTID
jgi:GNAT superfamily N-acetyltransferase